MNKNLVKARKNLTRSLMSYDRAKTSFTVSTSNLSAIVVPRVLVEIVLFANT